MKPPIGKRRTREHVIADLGVCFVEWQALLGGGTVDRVWNDYGIDLELRTYKDTGEREPGIVLIQVKATDRLLIGVGISEFSFRVERTDLVSWLAELEPVILIVFDAKRRRAYWVCVQDYFSALKDFNIFAAGKSISVRIPVANRVNARAMRRFAKMRDEYRQRSRRTNND